VSRKKKGERFGLLDSGDPDLDRSAILEESVAKFEQWAKVGLETFDASIENSEEDI